MKDALSDDFKQYIRQVISNSKALCEGMIKRGYKVVTGKSVFKVLWLIKGIK